MVLDNGARASEGVVEDTLLESHGDGRGEDLSAGRLLDAETDV